MMIKDKKGQMSVEVIFLFAISIIVLLVFTIPISQMAIENNLDVVNGLNTKSDLLKLINGIDNIYCQGSGAKEVIKIESGKDITVFIKPNYLSSQLELHDGKIKKFSFKHKADNVICNLKLEKGVNNVLISWPQDSKNILITKI